MLLDDDDYSGSPVRVALKTKNIQIQSGHNDGSVSCVSDHGDARTSIANGGNEANPFQLDCILFERCSSPASKTKPNSSSFSFGKINNRNKNNNINDNNFSNTRKRRINCNEIKYHRNTKSLGHLLYKRKESSGIVAALRRTKSSTGICDNKLSGGRQRDESDGEYCTPHSIATMPLKFNKIGIKHKGGESIRSNLRELTNNALPVCTSSAIQSSCSLNVDLKHSHSRISSAIMDFANFDDLIAKNDSTAGYQCDIVKVNSKTGDIDSRCTAPLAEATMTGHALMAKVKDTQLQLDITQQSNRGCDADRLLIGNEVEAAAVIWRRKVNTNPFLDAEMNDSVVQNIDDTLANEDNEKSTLSNMMQFVKNDDERSMHTKTPTQWNLLSESKDCRDQMCYFKTNSSRQEPQQQPNATDFLMANCEANRPTALFSMRSSSSSDCQSATLMKYGKNRKRKVMSMECSKCMHSTEDLVTIDDNQIFSESNILHNDNCYLQKCQQQPTKINHSIATLKRSLQSIQNTDRDVERNTDYCSEFSWNESNTGNDGHGEQRYETKYIKHINPINDIPTCPFQRQDYSKPDDEAEMDYKFNNNNRSQKKSKKDLLFGFTLQRSKYFGSTSSGSGKRRCNANSVNVSSSSSNDAATSTTNSLMTGTSGDTTPINSITAPSADRKTHAQKIPYLKKLNLNYPNQTHTVDHSHKDDKTYLDKTKKSLIRIGQKCGLRINKMPDKDYQASLLRQSRATFSAAHTTDGSGSHSLATSMEKVPYKSYRSEMDLTKNVHYLDAFLNENFDRFSNNQESNQIIGKNNTMTGLMREKRSRSCGITDRFLRSRRNNNGFPNQELQYCESGVDEQEPRSIPNSAGISSSCERSGRSNTTSSSLSSDYASVYSPCSNNQLIETSEYVNPSRVYDGMSKQSKFIRSSLYGEHSANSGGYSIAAVRMNKSTVDSGNVNDIDANDMHDNNYEDGEDDVDDDDGDDDDDDNDDGDDDTDNNESYSGCYGLSDKDKVSLLEKSLHQYENQLPHHEDYLQHYYNNAHQRMVEIEPMLAVSQSQPFYQRQHLSTRSGQYHESSSLRKQQSFSSHRVVITKPKNGDVVLEYEC